MWCACRVAWNISSVVVGTVIISIDTIYVQLGYEMGSWKHGD